MDYLNSLKQLTENFLSDYFDKDKEEDKNVKESLGIGAKQTNAPTAEVQVEQLADNKNVGGTSKVVANALATAYDNDDGEYETEEYDYQIQSGDTLTQIARRANMTIKELLKLNEDNPAIKTKDLIYAGGNIKLSRPVKTKEDIINFDTKPPAILTKESNVDRILYEMSEKYNLPFELVKAVGIKESGLNPFTSAGDAGTALGLMQVRGLALKDVNNEYGLNITREQQNPKSKEYDIRKSIESGVAYLALQRDRYGADPTDYYRMLAQYNGGPTGLKKAQAKKYAESVLNTMKTVKPFDFDADTMRADRTPPSEKDSFAVEMDNLSNEVEASGVAGVDFKLLKSATDYVKGVSLDNLLVSKADAMFVNPADVEALKLTDTTKNEIQSTIKEIDEIEQKNLSSMETKLQLREKLDNLKVAIENMSTNLGEVKDQTLQAMGSGGSAQSGMLGLGEEFRPNVDLSFLNPFKKDKGVEEKTVDQKRGVDLGNIKTAGFSLPKLDFLFNKAEASTPKDNEIDASLMLDKDLNKEGVFDILNKGWDSVLDYVPPNVRLYANDLLVPEFLKGMNQFTESSLSDNYKSLLGQIAMEVIKNKSDKVGKGSTATIEYADYKTDKSLETDDPYADVRYDQTDSIDLSDKRFNLKTSFGQADATINEKGELIITDRFNFNDAKDAQSVTELLHMVSEIGGAALRNEKYNLVRKVGKWYGSGEGKGQFVNINLGDYRQYLNEGALDEVKLPEPKPKGLMEKS